MLELFRTDLVQAKLLKADDTLGALRFALFFAKSRTCRIHFFIRLRASNCGLLRYFSKRWLSRYFIEVGSNTKIGTHFWLPHPRCIIIADHVIIGDHVHIGQYVTIGGNFKKVRILETGEEQRLPILGSRINVHPGAVIGGPVQIGSQVIIGANAVVTKDVPNNVIVFGQNVIMKKRINLPPEGGRFEVI